MRVTTTSLRNTVCSSLAIPGAASVLLAHNTHAQAVNGGIGFNGTATGSQSGGTTTLAFNNPMVANVRFGDFQGIPVGTSANFAPISCSGSGSSVLLTSNKSPERTIAYGGTTY